jgi:type I restriction enzyme S subunit
MPPVDEQVAAEAMVGGLERRVEREGGHLDKLRTLKHGLMDDLLTGRVRVTALSEATA